MIDNLDEWETYLNENESKIRRAAASGNVQAQLVVACIKHWNDTGEERRLITALDVYRKSIQDTIDREDAETKPIWR